MMSFSFHLPDAVSFEVPHQYASYCNGTIVQVCASEEAHDVLKVSWGDDCLNFASNGYLVRYQRERIVELFVDPSEHVKGRILCTLRVMFSENDGGKGTLVVLSSDAADGEWIRSIAAKLAASNLPVTMKVIPE
jgi:hypothetical protein